MSVQCLGWVLDNSEARLGARLVLIALANHANADGGSCYPSVDTIAKEARMSRRQVQNCIRELEDAGMLIVTRSASRYATNQYQIVMGPIDTERDDTIRDETDRGANIAPVQNPTARGAISDAQGCKIEPPTGRILHPNRHRTIKEPSLNVEGDKSPSPAGDETVLRLKQVKVTKERFRQLRTKYENLTQAAIIDELTELDRIWSDGGGAGGGPKTPADQWQRIHKRLGRKDREAFERIHNGGAQREQFEREDAEARERRRFLQAAEEQLGPFKD